MNRIAANDLSGPPGKAVYTQLCNVQGGIEADVTSCICSDDLLYMITGSGFGCAIAHGSAGIFRKTAASRSAR